MLRALWTLSSKNTLSELGVRRSDCLDSCEMLGSVYVLVFHGPLLGSPILVARGAVPWFD